MSAITKKKAKTIPAEVVFAEARKLPGYQEAYDALDEEFSILEELMKARAHSELSQTEIAKRMNASPSAISRLEAGAHRASLSTLRRYAKATGHRLRITLEPEPPRKVMEKRSRKQRG